MGDFAEAYESIKRSLDPKRVIVECSPSTLNETTFRKIGRYAIRRDPPHTGNDEYHAHCQLGGYEVCWTASGVRRHPNRFPADNKIPSDVKNGIADILGISVNLLECWQIHDNQGGDEYIITIREAEAPGADASPLSEEP